MPLGIESGSASARMVGSFPSSLVEEGMRDTAQFWLLIGFHRTTNHPFFQRGRRTILPLPRGDEQQGEVIKAKKVSHYGTKAQRKKALFPPSPRPIAPCSIGSHQNERRLRLAAQILRPPSFFVPLCLRVKQFPRGLSLRTTLGESENVRRLRQWPRCWVETHCLVQSTDGCKAVTGEILRSL